MESMDEVNENARFTTTNTVDSERLLIIQRRWRLSKIFDIYDIR